MSSSVICFLTKLSFHVLNMVISFAYESMMAFCINVLSTIKWNNLLRNKYQ
jgi:hypothetical protein